MAQVEKQKAGFKFGKFRTSVIRECGLIQDHDRVYKLVLLETSDGLHYYSLRFYNSNGHFIKQLLFEPWILNGLIDLLISESNR